MVVLNTLYNNEELDYIFKKINAIELIERYKSCDLVWDKLNPFTYHITKSYQNSYWDITLAIDFERVLLSLEFRRDGFHYITMTSEQHEDIWNFWNEIEDYENFYKDKKLLEAIHNFRGSTDHRIYEIVAEPANMLAGGTGLGFQVPYPPSNFVATVASYWDADIEETRRANGYNSFIIINFSHSFAYKYFNSFVDYYQVQHSKDGVNYFDSAWWSRYDADRDIWFSLVEDLTSGRITAPFNSGFVLELETATSYIFRVRGWNLTYGPSEWVYSNSVCTISRWPIDLTVSQTGTGTVVLNWNENNDGNCEIENHGIKYWEDGVSKGWLNVSETQILDTQVEVTGLNTGSTYQFKVGTIINGIIGPMSDISSEITLV